MTTHTAEASALSTKEGAAAEGAVVKARRRRLKLETKCRASELLAFVHMPDETADNPASSPEKGVAPKDKPDTGVKPDLRNPETPEQQVPDTPIHDMDPPGQGGPANS